MLYQNSPKSPVATRQATLPVARRVGGNELDQIRSVPVPSSSETRMQAAVVAMSSVDPYADPPCTD